MMATKFVKPFEFSLSIKLYMKRFIRDVKTPDYM